MEKLKYYNLTFDNFYQSQESKYTYDENPPAELTGMVDVMVYVCPHCIKKHILYKEAGMSTESVQYEIDNPYDNGLVCFVEGCRNMGATEVYLDEDNCKII